MWAISFSIAIGSYTTAFANIIGHSVLIGAAGITVATYTAAKVKPSLFNGAGRRPDGEHEPVSAVTLDELAGQLAEVKDSGHD